MVSNIRRIETRPLNDRQKLLRVNCNLCQSQSDSFLFKLDSFQKRNLFSTTSQGVSSERVVQCRRCGLIYVNPRMDEKIVVRQYSQGDEENYIKTAKGRLASFQRSMGIIKKYLHSGRVLDVGCAAGFFLKEAKDNGFEVYGVEPNKMLASWGKKNLSLNIFPGSFVQAKFPSGYFDLITFWDVLEHLADPMAALKKTNSLLKKKGMVLINYPDVDSFFAKLLRDKWWFAVSGHLYYFTPKTISKMLNRAGFKIVKQNRHYQILSFSYLLNRLGRYNPKLGNQLAGLSKSLKISNLLIPYYAGQRQLVAIKI